MESSVAFFFFFRSVENALLTCTPPQDRFYYPFGFVRVPGTIRRFHPSLGVEIDCLHGRSRDVPSPLRERVQVLAARIRRAGGACHCATFPECLPGPYESGEFEGTDLFCPVRASEILGRIERPQSGERREEP